MQFAEKRKMYQAEYHLLTQPYVRDKNAVVVQLFHPVQEDLFKSFRTELGLFLREKLRNYSIQLSTQLVTPSEEKKMIYTNREKFEYLLSKHPLLQELKDTLGLDPDF